MTLSTLSPELLVKIFQQLPFTDRFRYQRVCKLWNQILKTNDNVFKLDLGQIYANKDKNCLLIRKDIDVKGYPNGGELDSKLETKNFDAALLAILERTAPFLPSLNVDDYCRRSNVVPPWRDIVNIFKRRNPVALHTLCMWSWNTDDDVVADLKQIVSLCNSLRDLLLSVELHFLSQSDIAWSILEIVPPIKSLSVLGSGFSYDSPNDQLLNTIHQQLGPSIKRLYYSSLEEEEAGRFLLGFPHLQELGMGSCLYFQEWDVIFDAIINMPDLERLSFDFDDDYEYEYNNDEYYWVSDVTAGLKRIFDSGQQLKWIHLNSCLLRLPILLHILNHWSRSRSVSGIHPDLRVELGSRCEINHTELAETAFPAGFTVVRL